MFIAGQVIYYFVIFQTLSRMKIAVIGQSLFGADVYKLLQKDGHKIVGVFTVPDVNGKPDPLGEFMVCAVINCDLSMKLNLTRLQHLTVESYHSDTGLIPSVCM